MCLVQSVRQIHSVPLHGGLPILYLEGDTSVVPCFSSNLFVCYATQLGFTPLLDSIAHQLVVYAHSFILPHIIRYTFSPSYVFLHFYLTLPSHYLVASYTSKNPCLANTCNHFKLLYMLCINKVDPKHVKGKWVLPHLGQHKMRHSWQQPTMYSRYLSGDMLVLLGDTLVTLVRTSQRGWGKHVA